MPRNSETRTVVQDFEADRISRQEFFKRLSALGVTVGVLGPALAACGGDDATGTGQGSAEGATLGFGYPFREADFFKGYIAVIYEEAEAAGLEVRESFAGTDAGKQLDELLTWIEAGVDVAVVVAIDIRALAPAVKRANDAGMLIVGLANNIPGEAGYVIWNNREGGAQVGGAAGEFINKELNGRAEVALLTWLPQEATRERIKYARAAIEESVDDVTFYEVEALLSAEALPATRNLLQAHPGIRVIICSADDGSLGARAAYLNSGLPTDAVFIAGWDGSRANLDFISDNDKLIRATAALDQTRVAKTAVEVAVNTLTEQEPTGVEVPYILITHDTPASVISGLLEIYKQ